MKGNGHAWGNAAGTLVIGDGPYTANYKPYNPGDPAFRNFLASADTYVGQTSHILYDETAQDGDSGLYYTLFRIEPYVSST